MKAYDLSQKIQKTTGDLPTLPHVAAQVMKQVASERTTAEDLNRLISSDPALASRVLKIANSSMYAGKGMVKSLTQAIVNVGFNTIRSLVVAASTRELYPRFGKNEKLLWEHSIGCALGARILCMTTRFGDPEQAFLAGLLHDIGRTILLLRAEDRMRPILEAVVAEAGTGFRDREEEEFGFDHESIGQLLARRWNFGPEIEEAIGMHHSPEDSERAPWLTHIVCLSDAICHKLEIGPVRRPELDVESHDSATYLQLSAASVARAVKDLDTAMRKERQTFV